MPKNTFPAIRPDGIEPKRYAIIKIIAGINFSFSLFVLYNHVHDVLIHFTTGIRMAGKLFRLILKRK
jgi:hypothetical protein